MLKRVIQEIQTVLETSRTTPIKLGQPIARSRASIYTVVGEETEKVAKQTVSGDARDIVHCLREVLTLVVLGPSDMAVKVYGLFMGSMCWDETIMVSFRFSMKLMSGGQLPLVSDTFENQSRHKLSPHFALFLASLVINRILEIDAAVGLLDFTDSAGAELVQILITDFHTSCQHIHHHVDLHCQLEE